MTKLNVGDTVYLLPNAHGSVTTAASTPELFLRQLEKFGAVAYDSAFIVVDEVDRDGDVRIEVGENDFYVLAEFLTDRKPFKIVASSEPIPETPFQRGDKVQLRPGAHSSEGLSVDTAEKLLHRLEQYKVDYTSVFTVAGEKDSDGDVVVKTFAGNSIYVPAKYLVPYDDWEEKEEDMSQHMELGETYVSRDNDLYYRPTSFDFESDIVVFVFGSEYTDLSNRSRRSFNLIEEEFDVLPPVKPVNEYNTFPAEPQPEEVHVPDVVQDERPTVEIQALSEAAEFLSLDIYNLITLAKRLEK